MATIIELNDTAISLWRDQQLVLSSPGFALLGTRELVLGTAAFAGWRVNPRLAVNQFWQKLSQDALPQAAPGARTFADLAYRHLEQICAEAGLAANDEVMFAVPGTASRDQLALLLGMAGQLGLQATALVDLAVAQAAAFDLPGGFWQTTATNAELVVLDSHLHRTVLSRLQCTAADAISPGASSVASLLGVQEVEGGQLGLGQALVATIADQFVRETRFDPLHAAASEQQLWQGLPSWLEHIGAAVPGQQKDSVRVELHSGSRSHQIELASEALVRAAAKQCSNILKAMEQMPAGTPVLLTSAAAQIPGLAAALASQGHSQVQHLPAGAGAAGILRHQELVRSTPDSVQYVIRLPLDLLQGTTAKASASPTPPAAARSAAASIPPAAEPSAELSSAPPAEPSAETAVPGSGQADHLLLRDQAHAIGQGLVLGGSDLPLPAGGRVAQLVLRDGKLWLQPDAALRVNGDLVSDPLLLASGDRIEAGGALLTLIRVLPVR